jgi:hypothetical protein
MLSPTLHNLPELSIDLTLCICKTLKMVGMYAQGAMMLKEAIALAQTLPTIDPPVSLHFLLGEFAYYARDLQTAALALQEFLASSASSPTWERAQALHYIAILHSYPRTNRYL